MGGGKGKVRARGAGRGYHPRVNARVNVLPASVRRLASTQVPATGLQAGLRAATATVLPILLAVVSGRRELVWAAIGGWLTSIADAGGAYRTRARAMAAFMVFGAVTCAVASLVSPYPLLALVVLALWAAGGGLLRAAGDVGATLGVLYAATFSAALAVPASSATDAIMRGVLLASGGAGAMLLALVVWPVRPYGPAREAAASAVHTLSALARGVRDAYAAGLHAGAARPGVDPFATLARARHAPVRVAVEHARTVVAQTRRTRLASSRRSEDVVVLVELADELFATLVAAEDAVEAIALTSDADPALQRAVALVLAHLPDALDGLAVGLPSGRRAGLRPQALDALDAAVVALWEHVEPDRLDALEDAVASGTARGSAERARHAAALLEQAATLVEAAAETSATLVAGRDPAGPAPVRDAERTPPLAAVRRLLDGAVRGVRVLASPNAVTTRHALRLGVTVAIAQAIGTLAHLSRAQWITTTVLLVLQPYAGTTWQRGISRVMGTVLGGVVAALLAAVLRDQLLVAAIMFPLSVAAIAVRTVDYALFTFFLTPVFVLLAEPALGNWKLAGVRILDTVIGGVLAIVASRVLWPTYEHNTLPDTIGGLLDAVRAYFRTAARAAALPVPDDGALDAAAAGPVEGEALASARRRVGLAANAADAALQRWLVEPRGRWRDTESLMAVLAQARRVNGAGTGLATVMPSDAVQASGATALGARVAALDALLADLADAVRTGRAPAPPDDALQAAAAGAMRATAEHAVPVPAAVPLARLARHAIGLHAAVTRLVGAGADAEAPVARDAA